MSEKVVLWCRTGTWIKILAWMQMVWYGLKTLLFSLALTLLLWQWISWSKTHDESSDEVVRQFSELVEHEAEEVALHFHSFHLVVVITTVILIFACTLATIMGALLLKGGKQRNVPYLKSWLVFATISIFWHTFILLLTHHPIDLIEMIIFLPFYSFGLVITYNHMNGILADQNPSGQELPRYEAMEEEYV